jgi:hypothetical protein
MPVVWEACSFHTFGVESHFITGWLHGLLFRLGLTRALEYTVKQIPWTGDREYWTTVEVFNGPHKFSRYTGPAYCSTCEEVVTDVAWQAMMSLNYSHRSRLRDLIYAPLPQKRRGYRGFWVLAAQASISRGAMVHQ